MFILKTSLAVLATTPAAVLAHLCIWDPSMYGFNVTGQTFPYDNRPVVPMMNRTFEGWWFHDFLDYPPNDGDVFSFPAGGSVILPIACNKGLTPFWASSEGTTDIRQADGYPCPGPGEGYGMDLSSIHTTSYQDVTGTAIAIVDNDDVNSIQPEDFVVFTVNGTSPWTTNTTYHVPDQMPACTGKYCHCAWFWIHADDSGSEQNYMTGFRCNITNVHNPLALAKPEVPRYCPNNPSNCTQGAQNPFYWFQAERNNMPEGTYDPPIYQPKYGFYDGAQTRIFVNGPAATPASDSGASSSSAPVVTTTSASAAQPTSNSVATSTTPSSSGQAQAQAQAQSQSQPGNQTPSQSQSQDQSQPQSRPQVLGTSSDHSSAAVGGSSPNGDSLRVQTCKRRSSHHHGHRSKRTLFK